MASNRDGHALYFLLFTVAISMLADIGTAVKPAPVTMLSRKDFPADLMFGAASAAYQVEGAANEGGKGPSIWDRFVHTHPEKILGRSNADKSIDMYHHYKEDIGHMKETGLEAFRFSISWPRILPNGTISGGINKEGVQYYNNFINELLAKGIEPLATIFHWDLPAALDDEYGGFLSPRIVEDYKNYADLLFRLYGDRVKNWITFNEPYSFCQRGYAAGTFAPGRCSKWQGCAAGDAGREAYLTAHHLLLAHAAAVRIYREKYQATQKGKIGITLVTHWFKPYSESKADIDAAGRALDFYFGWFMDPLATGDYPFTMRAVARDRLPEFTEEQSKMLKGSFDFLGLNYYTTNYAKSISLMTKQNMSYDNDIHAMVTGERNGKLLGPKTGSDWLMIYPQGLRSLLLYIKEKYDNPIVYITENGMDTASNASAPLQEVLNDDIRIVYHRGHLLNLAKAISEGVNVKGYFAWSMFDSFEWDAGFTVRFGLYYVDYNTLKRYPKKSAHWYRNFLSKK